MIFDRYPLLQKVIVNTKTDRAFRGMLSKRTREFVVLKQAEMLKPRGETVRLDGEVIIDRDNVDFMQVVG